MLYLTVLFLLGLCLLNYALSRSALFPGTLFSGVWVISLLALLVSGDTFYPVSGEAQLVYVLGASFFSGGSLLVLALNGKGSAPKPETPEFRNVVVSRWVTLFVLILVACLPLYYRQVSSQIGDTDPERFIHAKRQFELENDFSRGFDPINNLPILSLLTAMVAIFEGSGSWWRRGRAGIAVLLALSYGAMTGSKGAVTILITAMFISFIRERRIKAGMALTVVSLSVVIFSLGLMAVNFVGKSMEELTENFEEVVETVQFYWLGGLVAFNYIVAAPWSVESSHSMNRSFLQFMNSLGGRYRIPSVHAEFSNVGPDLITNTYTIYFTYFKDTGWIGTCVSMFVLGALLTWCFQRAWTGRPIAIIFYAMFCTWIVMSVSAEHFLMELNLCAKALLFFLFLYAVPWEKLRPAGASLRREAAPAWGAPGSGKGESQP